MDICYVTYDQLPWQLFSIQNETFPLESPLIPPLRQYSFENITESLLLNLKQLFNIDFFIDAHKIDLNLLRIILCFHHQTCSLIFLIIFLLQNIFSYMSRLFSKQFLIKNFYEQKYGKNFPLKISSKTSFNGGDEQKSTKWNSLVFNLPDHDVSLSFQLTTYFKIKKMIAAMLIFINLIEISIILSLYEYDIFGVAFQYFCSNILLFSSSLCVIYYMFTTRKNNRRHQKFICFYWLLSLYNFLWNIFSVYTSISEEKSGKDFSLWKICINCYWNINPYFHVQMSSLDFRQIFISYHEENLVDKITIIWFHFNCFYFILFFVQFLLSFLPDFEPCRKSEDLKFNPEQNATLFSRLFFVWISSTIYRGYCRPLTISDIFPTSLPVEKREKYFSEFLFKKFTKHSKSTSKQQKTSFELIKILIHQFGLEFVKISLIKLIPTLMTFIGPLLLDRLIKFTTIMNNNDQPQWHGYAYVFAMFSLFLNESVLNSYSDYRLMVLALKIRTSLTASIYRHLLQSRNNNLIESSSKNQKYTSGQIVNIMSTDTQRVFEYVKIVNLFWICPLQIIIAILLLWQHLGYGSLAGLGVLFLLLPFNTFIGFRIRSLQAKLLEYKDRRIKSLNETLNGIRALKLYAWEKFFQKRISDSRWMEISNLRTQALYSAAITFAFNSAPFFVAFASFSLFIYINSNSVPLDANKAFVSLAIFNIIRRPLAFFPQLITNSMMFLISIKRIGDFLESYSDDSKFNDPLEASSKNDFETRPQIFIRNCCFMWSESLQNSFQLNQIDLNLKEPRLCAIIGAIGSGKSSLLSAILGQMKTKQEGPLHYVYNVQGKVAYVPQNSWIQSGTIRENILFGSHFDPIRYWKVIDACALFDDLKQMEDGDKTLVGEKGYNLSGGQRQRISLARAVYSDADLFLLDDPLSALDSQISKHIFQRVISNQGLLSNKIRLLVTHNMALLPHVDQIILLENGSLAAQGSYLELINQENEFTDFLTTYLSSTNYKNSKDFQIENQELVVEEEEYEILMEMAHRLEKQFSSFSRHNSVLRKISPSKDILVAKKKKNFKIKIKNSSKENSKIDFSESIRTGSISFKIYWHYIRAIGILPFILILLFYILGHCFVVFSNLWLSSWSNDHKVTAMVFNKNFTTRNESTDSLINNLWVNIGWIEPSSKPIDQWMRLNVYAMLGFGQTIFILIATLLLNFSCLRGSQLLHQSMLARMMHAPIWFFDQATSGQILNRFNKDIDLADTTLISTLRLFMIEVFRAWALFAIISLGTNSPIIICFFIPLIVAYFLIYKYYISTSRQLIRLESSLRTPIYLQFNETFPGVAVIQAFNQREMFLKKIYQKIDMNTSVHHMSIAAARWLSVRLECLGNLVFLITALSCVLLRGQITSGMVGLCITCSLAITGTLNLLIRSSIELENNIVAVERLVEYTRLPQEDNEWHRNPITISQQQLIVNNKKQNLTKDCFLDFIKGFLNIKQQKFIQNCLVTTNTSSNNILCSSRQMESKTNSTTCNGDSISFCQYSARYQNSLSLCLKNINLFIPPGTKVGIVGRTGAGKSSFAMALFRLIESEIGCIFINESNIRDISLYELRSSLTIIPQDPLLFTGTLRDNLDPFQHYTDQQIIRALNKAHLGEMACSAASLHQSMDNLINRLSFGQKQLFCLARALLRKSKILVLDEATAGIDPATDLLVQETIRQEFAQCTVLTIAHRLKTVLDYDRILVFDQGQVVEFDTPETLISNQSSLFYKMISQ